MSKPLPPQSVSEFANILELLQRVRIRPYPRRGSHDDTAGVKESGVVVVEYELNKVSGRDNRTDRRGGKSREDEKLIN
jgi:hypothetical protein